jgi:hypothetical protein
MRTETDIDRLKRWIAVDHDLTLGRLVIRRTALALNTTAATIRRDRKLFEDLGQEIVGCVKDEGGEYYYSYLPWVLPLFTRNANLRRR